MKQAINWCKGEYYITECIDKVAEYRVHFLQGRVLSIEEKIGEGMDKVAWNFALHRYVRWSQWNKDVVVAAGIAMKLAELDYGGVDVIIDAKGRPYVLEVNSAPHAPLLDDEVLSYHQKCFAKGFKWLSEHGRDYIPPGAGNVFWKNYIHPAISDEAKVG